MKTWLACVAGVYLCGWATGLAQNPGTHVVTERLEAVAKSYTEGNAFMGTVLVVEGDRVLPDQGYGMADLEWNISSEADPVPLAFVDPHAISGQARTQIPMLLAM